MKTKLTMLVAMSLFAGVAMAAGGWAEIRPEPPQGERPTAQARETVTDPVGDTFGAEAFQHDIVEFRGERSGTDLIITIVLNAPITPGDSGQTNALLGFVDIDSDQDSGTGSGGGTAGNCSPLAAGLGGGLGVDWVVDLFSYDSDTGQMFVTSGLTRGGGGGFVDASFSSNSVTITVPFATVQTADGIVDMATVVGTDPEPTDCAPDSGPLTVPVEVQSFEVE